ncbi:MAG: hypothetical protein LBD23_08010, partial [Oscillospiraceae bacterium]|nr:hypothetical protein [Oscillospiraceae bacterium]
MKKNKLFEKSLSLLIAFVMVFGVLLFIEMPQVAAATTEPAANEEELKGAIDKFNHVDNSDDMTINITTSFDITSATPALPAINNSNDKTLTIKSDSATPHTLTFTSLYISGQQGNPYFRINNGTLVLENITVVGYIPTPTDAPIVTVNSGTLIMNDGATLTGNNSNVTGAGVLINNGGSFIMKKGSTISQNKVGGSSGGGGVYITGGTFIMEGGTISGNTSTGGGGGVNIVGGGTFTMTDGTISGNKAGAGGDFSGGGVSVMGSSTFTMTGGIIKDNSSLQDGGGVYIANSDITIGGDAEISGNTAERDGGGIIKTAAGDITIIGNARISGNEAKGRGGGVLIGDTDDIIIGGGAVISGNSLTNGATDNLTLLGLNTFITLGTNGANAPNDKMSIGVSKILDKDEDPDARENVIVKSGASESHAK